MSKISTHAIQLNPNLYLTKYSTTSDDPIDVREPLNHIWIYDRSGSMCGLLDDLVEDLINRAKLIPIGDTLTLGWFSTEGRRNFIVKGFKITEQRDYSLIEKVLRQNNTTIGLTCFSEILEDTDQVITDLSIFSPQFALCFFTDGYPVVSSYQKEINAIYSAVSKIASRLTSALLIGYGDYYNKELMATMAEKIGGSLTHSANLSNFSITLNDFIKISESSKRIPIKISETLTPNSVVFNINEGNINVYTPNEDNEVAVSYSTKEVDLFVLTETKPQIKLTANVTDAFIQGCYAASYLLTQKTKTDVAIDVLAFVGDKRLIDGVVNAYTNAEYGRAENSLREAVIDSEKRFTEGKVSNYVPPVDAFCLLDLIDVLANDQDAYFYPRHKDFQYRRVGKASKVVEGFPEFVADVNSRSSFADVVWNETKINLSLRAILRGTIDLGSEAHKYGLMQEFPTFQFRNYTFVKDGILNVAKVPASFSEKTFKALVKTGVLVLDSLERLLWEKDKIYTLSLDAIPIVNRKIASRDTSAMELCNKVIKEHEYKAIIKTLKWYKNTYLPEQEVTAETAKTFVEKQIAFLESKGVNTKTGAFEPDVKAEDSVDFYLAKEFEIKVKGLSSLPKVEAVLEKMKNNKKLTASDKLITAGIQLVPTKETMMDTVWGNKLDNLIADYQNKLKSVRRGIQEVKFALLLGKMWFNEFTSREENKLTVGEYEVTICLSEKKVAF